MIGKVIVTGQEAPQTDRLMKEDLYKKHITGEPISCRPNYAVLTRQVSFPGWKRFEMNDTLKFQGVREETFPSIMRRSLVIIMKARFSRRRSWIR